MLKNLKYIWFVYTIFLMVACGSTRVAVSQPQQGTTTTITVTTNNPITTTVTPETNLDLEGKTL